MQVLLHFQLQGHVQYLLPFGHLFRQLDPRRRGVISEADFRQLARAIEPSKSEGGLLALLHAADPHNLQRITFSEAVTALTNDLHRLQQQPDTAADDAAGPAAAHFQDITDRALLTQ